MENKNNQTTNEGRCQKCGADTEVLDRGTQSETRYCTKCSAHYLHLAGDELIVPTVIPLPDFHLKRGQGLEQRQVDNFTMAENLVGRLLLDEMPTPAMCIDFGIQDDEQYRALQIAVDSGIRAYELDRVLGFGPAITALVHSIRNQPLTGVTYEAPYDKFVTEILNHI